MKGGDMLSMKQIICEMEADVSKLQVCLDEKRFLEMSYLLGKLGGYSLVMQQMVSSKIQESKEVTNEEVP